MKKEALKTIGIVTAFAIAMGFLESVVVIYLRKLYYPSGFAFPLKGFIEPGILSLEWIRELATIVMLLSVGYIAGKKAYEKFAYFIYAFAIWDIFYYIFLKLALNWPASLLDWDLLFLIPWPWIGPVLAPILCSILLIIFALLILKFQDKGKKVEVIKREWNLFVAGMAIVLYTWLKNYGPVPSDYNWLLFAIGVILVSAGIVSFHLRTSRKR